MTIEFLKSQYEHQIDDLIQREIFPYDQREEIIEALFHDGPSTNALTLTERGSRFFQGLRGEFRSKSVGQEEPDFVLLDENVVVTKFLHTDVMILPKMLIDSSNVD